MKAEIDDAVEKITKHTSTPAMPTLAISTEHATNAAIATENATNLPSEPATETPNSGSGTASTAATVATRTENVPTETRPRSLVDNVSSVSHSFDLRLSVSGFRRSTLSTARPVLRLRPWRTANRPSFGGSGHSPFDGGQSELSFSCMHTLAYPSSSSRTQHRASTTSPQPIAPVHITVHSLNAPATNGAGLMEVCQPDPPSALPFLMPPSRSGSSTASNSSSSSLAHTPPEGSSPKAGVVSTGPAVDDPTRTARAPAPYTSVVEGRDDETKPRKLPTPCSV